MKKNQVDKWDLLILGKTPPPIGGVTIHVKRLTDFLHNLNYPSKFIFLDTKNIINIINNLFRCKCVHLHTSNVFLQFILSLLSKLFGIKSIITYHGDLNRYSGIKNNFALLSLKLCTYPIVLNETSIRLALKHNKKALKISAFIPPLNEEPLSFNTIEKINKLKSEYKRVYSTNAYGLTFDKYNMEIYGILDLIDIFNTKSEYALIISDPSSSYHKYFVDNNLHLNKNILVLNYPHSFCEILRMSDASIRNTSTDGDALSIKESLFFNIPTFATDVVSRNENVITYKRGEYDKLFYEYNSPKVDKDKLNGSIELLKLYNSIIK